MLELEFICDTRRHLICLPYSVENLHAMAAALGLHSGWYHPHGRLPHPHYDIPQRRKRELEGRCRIVSSKEIIRIMREAGI